MDDQQSLFAAFEAADRRLSRESDPRTSKLAEPSAAKQLTAQQLVLWSLASFGQATANEIALRAESSPLNTSGVRSETCRKRVAELVRSGQIEAIGERHCRITGKLATVYGSK